MQQLFESALQDLDDNEPARKAVQRRCIQSVSERDYSSQEILHLATSQKLFHSSRTFVKINFRESEWVAAGGRAPAATPDSDQETDQDLDPEAHEVT